MKKFIKYILLIIIIVIAIPSKQTTLTNLIKQLNYKNVLSTYYTKTEFNNLDNVIKNGNQYMITCDIASCDEVEKQLTNIQGQSVCFKGEFSDYISLKEKLLNKVVFEEELYNIKTCYGYNNNLTNTVKIDNKSVNIQIVYSNNNIIVGCPVILGSF